MRPFRPILLACCALPLLTSGCAKSPSGGPTQTANRIQAQLNLAGTLNQTYYYGVAFDDNGGDGRGPVAIIGSTNILNRVVGGNFRLLVLYHANRFQVFYRTDPTDLATEREITGTDNLFVIAPAARANGIGFTLNLDARLANGTYIFPRGASSSTIASSRFDINAVTTGPESAVNATDQNNNITRPVDALGPQQVASPIDVQIGGTLSRVLQDATGAATDRNFADPTFTTPGSPDYVDFSQIDIDNLQLAITRSLN